MLLRPYAPTRPASQVVRSCHSYRPMACSCHSYRRVARFLVLILSSSSSSSPFFFPFAEAAAQQQMHSSGPGTSMPVTKSNQDTL
jgi:hypothetical protein